MSNFEYYSPTKVVFGKDSESQIGVLVEAQNCHKVLIHYGSGSVIKTGLLDKVKKALQEKNINFIELGGVVPNPRLSLVYEGIKLVQENDVDFILALGGGSVIDSAKAIAIGAVNDFDVWDIFEGKNQAKQCLPIGVVLTIAAAGSETSKSLVISKEEEGLKRGYGSNLVRPKFAIMNPTLTMTLPDYQTSCGSVDILMHTMERYFTSGSKMEITDALAEGLMKTVMKNALILIDNPQNYDARAEVMWAGSLSHNGLTGCGNDRDDFATHALEHELSALYDVAHGAGLAAMWGSWARYVCVDCLPRFVQFALNVMEVSNQGSDLDIAFAGIRAMEEFFSRIQMPINLQELGIDPSDDDLILMAKKCAISKNGSCGSAKILHEEDMLSIYRSAR